VEAKGQRKCMLITAQILHVDMILNIIVKIVVIFGCVKWLITVDNMKWLGFGATNLSHATKLIGSKLAKKSDNTQLFYIMC